MDLIRKMVDNVIVKLAAGEVTGLDVMKGVLNNCSQLSLVGTLGY